MKVIWVQPHKHDWELTPYDSFRRGKIQFRVCKGCGRMEMRSDDSEEWTCVRQNWGR